MKRIANILFGLMLTGSALAQDYTFTNNNVVPFSLNPALVGNANTMRFSLDYRMQWPTLDNHYNTTRLSFDMPFYKHVSSLGVSYVRDNLANVFYDNQFSAIYSHNIRLEDDYYIRLGVQVSFVMDYLDGDLTLRDMMDDKGQTIAGESIDPSAQNHLSYADFSFGGAFVIENMLTVGASVYHIGEPNNGFDDDEAQQLGRKYVFHVNYMHDLESRSGLWGRRDMSGTYLFGSASYQQQSVPVSGSSKDRNYKLACLSVGAMTNPVLFGVSDKYDFSSSYGNLNTVSLMVGGNYRGLQLYYIFDLYTSKKDNGSWSHELSFVYVMPDRHYRYACPIVYW